MAVRLMRALHRTSSPANQPKASSPASDSGNPSSRAPATTLSENAGFSTGGSLAT